MDHCGINSQGPGIADTGIDPLTALEQWVETGLAPEALLATKLDGAGQTAGRRPICAYPQAVQHDGRGDPKDPTSFRCAER
jgi:feruloyl esterase